MTVAGLGPPFAQVPLLRAANLTRIRGIDHAFTTRHGGVSTGAYTSLNLGGNTADDPTKVQRNRSLALQALGRPANSWVGASQVHGSRVATVQTPAQAMGEADALISQNAAVTLATLVADCVPVLLAAGGGEVVASVHAGWRGTAARIAAAAATACCKLGDCAPQHLQAALGPAIGPCCFAVGAEVASKLRDACLSDAQQAPFVTERGGQFFADLWRINAAILADAGVPPQNVEVLAFCTACGPHAFSYRASGGVTGRQAALIGRRHPGTG